MVAGPHTATQSITIPFPHKFSGKDAWILAWPTGREFTKKVIDYLQEGRMIYIEDFVDGLESAPSALIRLLEGKNVGKQVVRL